MLLRKQSQEVGRPFILCKTENEHCPTAFNIYDANSVPPEKAKDLLCQLILGT